MNEIFEKEREINQESPLHNWSRTAGGSHTISTTVSHELWIKCKEKRLSWAECLRIGISVKLSETEDDLNNPLNLKRKLERLVTKLQELADENAKLQEQTKLLRFG